MAASLGILCFSLLPIYVLGSGEERVGRTEVKCNYQTPTVIPPATPKAQIVTPRTVIELKSPVPEPSQDPLLKSGLGLESTFPEAEVTSAPVESEPRTDYLGQHLLNLGNQEVTENAAKATENTARATDTAKEETEDTDDTEETEDIEDAIFEDDDDRETGPDSAEWGNKTEAQQTGSVVFAPDTTLRPKNSVIPVTDPNYQKYWDKKKTDNMAAVMAASALASTGDADGELMMRPPSDEERLLYYLFHHYNPSARPVIDSSKTVAVNIQYSLMHIKDLDIRSQVFTTTGLLILEWTDERLTWSQHEHNNMSEVIVEAKGIWRPEFAVINGAENVYEDYNQFRAVITHEGSVHWEPGGVFKTMCEIDITYYPFDEQKCVLVFGAWSYHTGKMNLTNISHIVNLDSYKGNGEWEVYHTQVIRNEFSYDCCPNERFSNMAFEVYLRRRHTFYILNVILPSIMTSVLLLSVFFCTPGQKVQIGVVVLLSFRIFMLNVADNIPKTSDHIPILGIYLTCTMAITTLSMVLTVFVLNLHHMTDKAVPPWLQRLVFIYLARMLGMCSTANDAIKLHEKQQQQQQQQQKRGKFFQRASIVVDAELDERAAIIEMNNCGSGGVVRKDTNDVTANDNAPPNSQTVMKNPKTKVEDEKKDEDYSKDWKRLAEIFDRLFFWLFLLAILISTLILFHPLTKSYMQQEGII